MKLLKLFALIIAGIALTLPSCVKEKIIEEQPILEKATSRSSMDIEQKFRETFRSIIVKLDAANKNSNGQLLSLLNQLKEISNERHLNVLRSSGLLDMEDLIATTEQLQTYGNELINLKRQDYPNRIIGEENGTNFLTNIVGDEMNDNFLTNIVGDEVGTNFLTNIIGTEMNDNFLTGIIGTEMDSQFLIDGWPSWLGGPHYSDNCDCHDYLNSDGISFYWQTCSEVMFWGLFETGNWSEPVVELGTCK
ncbi:MAG: hypothetical protein AB8G86_24750 [Saprospiraceae bacterium]